MLAQQQQGSPHLRQHTSRMMLAPTPNAPSINASQDVGCSPIMITSQELHELEGQMPNPPLNPSLKSRVEEAPVMIDRDQLIKKLMSCHFCNDLPENAVETPCCGKLYCWECAVTQSEDNFCECGAPLPIEAWKPAKAVERMLRESSREGSTVQRPTHVQCPECGKSFPNSEVEEHLQKCEEVLLPCSHCFAQFSRGQLDQHVKNECPLASVTCKFGCEEQLVRRELEEHMEQNVEKHLGMLQATVERQQQIIDTLSKEANRSFTERIAGMTFRQALLGIFFLFLLMWLKIRVTPVVIVGSILVGLVIKLTHEKRSKQNVNPHGSAGSCCVATSGDANSCLKRERKGCKILLCVVFVWLLYCLF